LKAFSINDSLATENGVLLFLTIQVTFTMFS